MTDNEHLSLTLKKPLIYKYPINILTSAVKGTHSVQYQHLKNKKTKTHGRVFNELNEIRYKQQLHIKIVVLKSLITYFFKNISISQKLKDICISIYIYIL